MKRTVIGPSLQAAGGAAAVAGVFVLFGLGVMLVVLGVGVAAYGVLHEMEKV